MVFDIKRYAINDGPGIRTTIFLKGCPLRCIWCHNPEGWTAHPQLLYKQSKCIGCQTCVNVCPRQALTLTPQGIALTAPCPAAVVSLTAVSPSAAPPPSATESDHQHPLPCVDACPTTALELCGRSWPLPDLMAEIEKERMVMEQSGGGVTLCGGEPLMHPDYTLQLLRELGSRGFHRCVDTTLYAPTAVVAAVAAHCDLFLADLKLMDDVLHRRYTGVSNALILQNFRYLADHAVPFLVRIPLIEGINADPDNIEATARFLVSLPTPPQLTTYHLPLTTHNSPSSFSNSQILDRKISVHLLPYHDVGKDKHRRMLPTLSPDGTLTPASRYNPDNIPMSTPSDDTLARCTRQLEAHGLHVVIGG